MIQAHRAEYSLILMCRVLHVSRSGFYAWQAREPSRRQQRETALRERVRSIYRQSRGRYGSPRVHAELRAAGERCSRKRIERLMREDALVARVRRRFRGSTTDSQHAEAIVPNLLQRDFSAEAPDQVWVSDITYLPTRQGWLYLAVVLDLATRAVVGWSMRPSLEAALAVDALQMALQRRKPKRGLIHHSDRGVQYACGAYQEQLERAGLRCSMSRKGDCWDNAVAESFFATLEWELVEGADWHTHAEAKRALFEYLEIWYNRQRRHSSLGYVSPAEYEAHLTPRRAA